MSNPKLFTIISILLAFVVGVSMVACDATKPEIEYVLPDKLYAILAPNIQDEKLEEFLQYYSKYELEVFFKDLRQNCYHFSFNSDKISAKEMLNLIKEHPNVLNASLNLRLLNWENGWIRIQPDYSNKNFEINEFLSSYSKYNLKLILSSFDLLFSFNNDIVNDFTFLNIIHNDPRVLSARLHYYNNPGDFNNNTLFVIMTKEVSGVNKVHKKENFGQISNQITRIEDLTHFEDPTSVNIENFRQILLISLNKKSRKNVLKVVDYLNEHKNIYKTEPNWFVYGGEK